VKKIIFGSFIIGAVFLGGICSAGENTALFIKKTDPALPHVSIGNTKETLFKTYPKTEERTYRGNGVQEWITFNTRDAATDEVNGFVTFYLKNDVIKGWAIGDRREVVTEYMSEFCSQAFKINYVSIHEAIKYVLTRIPQKDFLTITERSYPVVFTEYHNVGQGQYANSAGMIGMKEDPPTFTGGFYLVKLNTGMNNMGAVKEIAGVVAHELAHRVLGHSGAKEYSLDMERKANVLIIKWGFQEEFKKACQRFGE